MLSVLGLVVVLLSLNTWFAYHHIRQMHNDARMVDHTHNVINALESIISFAKDAETGQRGYIITGEPRYFVVYDSAVSSINEPVRALEQLTRDNPSQQARIPALKNRITNRLKILEEALGVRKEKGFAAAREMILTDRGKIEMDDLRKQVDEMTSVERQLLAARSERSERTYRVALLTTIVADLFALAMVVAFILLLRRHLLARDKAAAAIHEQREMFRTTIASIGDAVMTTDTQGRVTYLNSVARIPDRLETGSRGRPTTGNGVSYRQRGDTGISRKPGSESFTRGNRCRISKSHGSYRKRRYGTAG